METFPALTRALASANKYFIYGSIIAPSSRQHLNYRQLKAKGKLKAKN